MAGNNNDNGERFTGHGSEWRDSNLSEADALTATSWVESKIDKRSMLTNKSRVHDIRDVMWQLEKRRRDQSSPRRGSACSPHGENALWMG